MSKETEGNGWQLKPGDKENKNKLPDPLNGNFQQTPESDTNSEPDASKKDEVPSIPFITLFRFATLKDKIFITLALICSTIAAISTPLKASIARAP